MIGHSIDFDVHVVGDPAVGIKKVWVTYTYGDGEWQSLFLTLDTADQTHWSGAIADSAIPAGKSAADLRYIVQAVNGVGLVSLDSNNGAFYQVQTSETAPTLNTTHLGLDSIASPGTFGGTTTIGATLSGADSNDGQPIVLTLGGITHVVTTVSGHASSSFPLNQSPATYPVTAAFVTDGVNAGSQASSSFTIQKAQSSLALAGPASGVTGASSGVTATLKDDQGQVLGQRTVVFTVQGSGASNAFSRTVITDSTGVAALGTVPLTPGAATISANFAGTVTLIPSSTQLDMTDTTYKASSASQPYQVLNATPTFTFDTLPGKTFGDADFSVASAVHTNSPGAVTFALVTGSTSCTVSSVGLVHITGASAAGQTCNISATLAAGGNYLGAGPIRGPSPSRRPPIRSPSAISRASASPSSAGRSRRHTTSWARAPRP